MRPNQLQTITSTPFSMSKLLGTEHAITAGRDVAVEVIGLPRTYLMEHGKTVRTRERRIEKRELAQLDLAQAIVSTVGAATITLGTATLDCARDGIDALSQRGDLLAKERIFNRVADIVEAEPDNALRLEMFTMMVSEVARPLIAQARQSRMGSKS